MSTRRKSLALPRSPPLHMIRADSRMHVRSSTSELLTWRLDFAVNLL